MARCRRADRLSQQSLQPLAFGFINGFSCFLLTGSGGVAALAMAAVTAYRTVFEISDIMVKVLAIAIILVLMVINLLGVREMTFYQNFSMVIRMVPILMIIIAGFVMGKESPDLSLSLAGTSAEGGGRDSRNFHDRICHLCFFVGI